MAIIGGDCVFAHRWLLVEGGQTWEGYTKEDVIELYKGAMRAWKEEREEMSINEEQAVEFPVGSLDDFVVRLRVALELKTTWGKLELSKLIDQIHIQVLKAQVRG